MPGHWQATARYLYPLAALLLPSVFVISSRRRLFPVHLCHSLSPTLSSHRRLPLGFLGTSYILPRYIPTYLPLGALLVAGGLNRRSSTSFGCFRFTHSPSLDGTVDPLPLPNSNSISMAQQQPPASPAPAQARSSMPPPAPGQPYPAYAYPAYPPVTPARQIPYDKNWFRAKLILTGLSLVWCIILLGLALASIFHPFDGFYGSPLAAFWCLPLVIPTAIWDIAELITVCACGKRHGNKQGIHPGAHVGVDLVIWLASLLCVLFSTSAVVLMASDIRYCSGRPSAANQSYYGYYCDDVQESGRVLSLARALLAFVCLLTSVKPSPLLSP